MFKRTLKWHYRSRDERLIAFSNKHFYESQLLTFPNPVQNPDLGVWFKHVPDGASYHSSPTARDRDRLRQQVLEKLGWNIHRIWSTDWFRNKPAQVRLLVEKIERLLSSK